ncbi:MAG: hypothetical protein GY727_00545, partial [Gammaproteobacteria bacterium]|nr:hypothetical protein [Gammaproteobacteria bacterium]
MFEIREGKAWNIANLWLGTKAAPTASAIMKELKGMAANQQQLVEVDAVTAKNHTAFLSILEWILLVSGVGISVVVAFFINKSVFKQVGAEPSRLQEIAKQIADGNLDVRIVGNTGIAASIKQMVDKLSASTKLTTKQLWLSEGLSGINNAIRGETDIGKVASIICEFLAKYLKAQILTFYTIDEEKLQL